jgi:hypothetical protein
VVERSVDEVMAQMYALMMKGQTRRVHVCRSLVDAASYLGRPI